MASVWGGDSPSVAWGQNAWASNTVTISLTGVSATSSVGAITPPAMQVGLTGLGATSSVGTVVADQTISVPLTAPSGLTSSVGSISMAFVQLTAPSQLTSELGTFDNAGTLIGWGRNGWGEEGWGNSFNQVILLTGLSATASVGAITPADVVGLTGVSSTASVGSISPADVMGLTGVSSTASVGSIISQITTPLSAPSAVTASVGAITPADVVGLTGVSSTASVGSLEVTEKQIIFPTGMSLTSSVGSITTGITVPLTAPTNATASVGAIVPADVVGVTGLEVTAYVGSVGPTAYQDIDITGYTSYTDVNHVA